MCRLGQEDKLLAWEKWVIISTKNMRYGETCVFYFGNCSIINIFSFMTILKIHGKVPRKVQTMDYPRTYKCNNIKKF